MLAINDAAQVRGGFRFLEPVDEAGWRAMRRGAAVFVSEALAYRHRLAPGDRLHLDSPGGPRAFAVAGVFRDYSSERGLVVIDRASYARLWDDPGVTTAGLALAPDADRAAVLAAARRLAGAADPPLQVRANADIRAQSMAVFDRTFAITAVLRLLAIGVAFIGVLSALLALQLDRVREHATLRALGVTPRQLGGLLGLECGLMGLAAGVLALPLGWVMAQLLMHVINRRSFGWSMQSLLPPEVFAEAVVLALAAALLASIYPGWRLARRAPATALREE
jgi:putative ABC transport system permease protein